MADVRTTTIDVPGFGGELVYPGDAAHDDLRSVFNGMIDRRPGVIARCTSADDVATAVNIARELDIPLSIYGGGHGVTGAAVVDEGICVDLRTLARIDVDPEQRVARVEGGARWGAIDAATQEHGLAVTGGRISDTGIGGLALGSGSGWLERKYGFTCDNLVKAEVVTADGRQVVASEDENPDLFWGLRGGGGNFGVVTAFHLRVHPVGPIVLAGQLMHQAEMADDLLRFYRDFILAAPDEVCGGVAFITAPPEEFVPEPVRGQPVVGVVVLYAGDVAEGEEAFRPLREFGPPGLDMVQPMPYVAVQQMLDAANQSGRLNYWTADFYDSLPDEAIDTFVPRATHPISPLSQVIVMPGGGALSRVPQEATAFPQRNAEWNLHYLSMWEDPAETDHNISWTRDFSAAMKPWSSGRQYLNMLDEDRVERVAAAYGPEKFAELQALKAKWDPTNLFCHNQNIPPAG
ncbi:MAG TPA: FAD-binding oxidoreductase [Acidimicrobiia bacterium]|nr:FAD-binding oxidoreductase [Acidimicrobiia bacterium]